MNIQHTRMPGKEVVALTDMKIRKLTDAGSAGCPSYYEVKATVKYNDGSYETIPQKFKDSIKAIKWLFHFTLFNDSIDDYAKPDIEELRSGFENGRQGLTLPFWINAGSAVGSNMGVCMQNIKEDGWRFRSLTAAWDETSQVWLASFLFDNPSMPLSWKNPGFCTSYLINDVPFGDLEQLRGFAVTELVNLHDIDLEDIITFRKQKCAQKHAFLEPVLKYETRNEEFPGGSRTGSANAVFLQYFYLYPVPENECDIPDQWEANITFADLVPCGDKGYSWVNAESACVEDKLFSECLKMICDGDKKKRG